MYLCNVIFYFSATGNTRWAAEYLAEATHDKLVCMAEVMSNTKVFHVDKDERIGFVFPVHGWRPPLLVRRFIGQLEITGLDNNFCYAVCTAGDDIGQSMEILNHDLSRLGIKAESIYSLLMPESYVGLPFMDVDTPEKEKAKKQRSAEQIGEFAEEIVNCQRGIVKTYKGHWPHINSWLLGTLFVHHLITDKPFHVEESKCLRCGKCSEACPTHNIEGGKHLLPQWKHQDNCLTCFACYHHCPVHAIEYGNRTKKKGQYYFTKKNQQ